MSRSLSDSRAQLRRTECAHFDRKVFTSRRVVLPNQIGAFGLLVEGEKIEAVVPQEQIPCDVPVTDFGTAAILPGLVDSHIHINEPGRTEWEGFRTATRAAAAGGYTTLVDMPLNCVPSTTSVEALEAKRHAARGQCYVDWTAWGGVVAGNQNHIAALAQAGVAGFKCFLIHPGTEEFSMVDEHELRAALPIVRKTGSPLLVHSELPGPVEAATKSLADSDWQAYDVYLQSRPEESEIAAIGLLLRLCEEFRCRIHVVHLSAASAISILRDAKNRGLPVTVETCPHYLHLVGEEIGDGATQYKCAPPIRDRQNREALWEGLRDGIVDLIATDHSPCPPAMKHLDRGDFRGAWGGISSVSVALSVVWTEAQPRGFSLSDIARWMAQGPAELAGLQETKGQLAVGLDADFAVFAPETEWTVSEPQLYFRHPVTPYLGETLKGKVLATYLRGECVFRDNAFTEPPRGRDLTAQPVARGAN